MANYLDKQVLIHRAVFLSVLLLAIFLGFQFYDLSRNQQEGQKQPEINLDHIFNGAINSHGKPTGFHSRPGGIDPEHARLKTVLSPPNSSGIYTARVEIYDPVEERWKEKYSTMFPDTLDKQQVITAILHAWEHRNTQKKAPWEGASGMGFMIQGYLSRQGNINTAYPLYSKQADHIQK